METQLRNILINIFEDDWEIVNNNCEIEILEDAYEHYNPMLYIVRHNHSEDILMLKLRSELFSEVLENGVEINTDHLFNY
jgi:hypothetical protein